LVTCSQLHQLTGADVIALDLRGHGESAGIPGDTQYIGQYEDDVSDVMTALRSANPEAKVILAGHSMGGGIAMRYAAMHEAPVADAYLLFAPHLGVKSPTMRTEPTANEPFVQLNLRRTVGLVMLNTMRVRWFNSLPTLLFNVPVSSPIHAYSFRAMASTSPDDYVAALTADAKPLLTLVGEGDEVFHAERFPSVISMHKNGRAVMIPGEQHDSIARSSSALSVAVAWIRSLDDPRSLGSAKGKPLQGM
jgi:alpha-beta hydrolase superfamily lysophospholipase